MTTASTPEGGLVAQLLTRVAGASAVNLAMQVFSTVLGLVVGLILSRLLGAEGLGVYAFAFASCNLLGVLGRLGLEHLMVREMSMAGERQDWGLVLGMVRFAEPVTVAVSGALGVLAAGLALMYADAATGLAMVAAIPMLVAMGALQVRSAALRGVHAVVASQIPIMVVRPVLFISLVGGLYLWSARNPWNVVAAHGAAYLVAWGVAVALWRRLSPDPIHHARAIYRVRAWMGSAFPLLVMGGLGVINLQGDLMMLKWLSGDTATGIYSVAAQLSRLTTLVLTVVNIVVAPRFAALHARGDLPSLQRLVSGSAAGITLATLPVVLATILGGELVLGLYADGFTAGYGALVVLVSAQMVNALSGSVGNLMVMTGHEREVGLVTGATVVLNLVLNLVLVPRLGMLGAAVASASAMIAWNVVLVLRVRRLLGVDSTVLGWLRSQRENA